MRFMPSNSRLSISLSYGLRVSMSVAAAAVISILPVGPVGIGYSAFAQQPTPDQIIEALKSRTSRGIGPIQSSRGSAPGQGQSAREEAPQDVAAKGRRMSELLDVLRKRGGRAFTAKQREELADLSQSEPSINLVVYFDLDSARVREDSKQTLAALGTALRNAALKDGNFLISGHTDASGGAPYNLSLSQRRAEAVSAYLRQAFGIEPGRLQPIGYGKEQLKRPDDPLSGENRRVQVVNVSVASQQAATELDHQQSGGTAERPAPVRIQSPAVTPSVAPRTDTGGSGSECRRFSPQANKTVPCD